MHPIGYVVHVRTPGTSGGGARSYQVAQALGASGTDVHLYGGVSDPFDWAAGVHPHQLRQPAPLGLVQLTRDFCLRDVGVAIERYHLPPFNVAYFAQRIRSKPIVFEVHGFPIEELALLARLPDLQVDRLTRLLAMWPRSTWERLQSSMFSRVAHFIATSAGTREILMRLGVPASQISVIYNCVDPALFSMAGREPTDCRKTLKLPADGQIVLYAGSLFREALSTIVDIASISIAAQPSLSFVCAVVGPADALEGLARSRGLSPDQFRMFPPVSHQRMPDLLAASDVVLAPYSLGSERFKLGFHYSPLKVMEALAMEKPVVTVDACELRHIFGGVPNVQFATSGDSKSWAEGILRALNTGRNPVLARGREFVMDGYRWQDAALKYLNIVRSVEENKG